MVPNGQLALAVHLKDVGSSGVIHVVAQPRQSQNIDVEVIQVLLALFQVCQSVAALHHGYCVLVVVEAVLSLVVLHLQLLQQIEENVFLDLVLVDKPFALEEVPYETVLVLHHLPLKRVPVQALVFHVSFFLDQNRDIVLLCLLTEEGPLVAAELHAAGRRLRAQTWAEKLLGISGGLDNLLDGVWEEHLDLGVLHLVVLGQALDEFDRFLEVHDLAQLGLDLGFGFRRQLFHLVDGGQAFAQIRRILVGN